MKCRLIPVIAAALIVSTTGCNTRWGLGFSTRPAAARPAARPLATADQQKAQSRQPATSLKDATNAAANAMACRAELIITSGDASATVGQLKTMTASLKGTVQELSQDTITIRIPAASFDEAMRQIEAMGTVQRRKLSGQDTSDEVADLEVRIKNTEEVRLRLCELVRRGGKLQDVLALEKELQRVTETSEQLKRRAKEAAVNVAQSLLKITVDTPLPDVGPAGETPFEWVRQLGSDVGSGPTPFYKPARQPSSKIHFECPANYVKADQKPDSVRALSGENVVVLVSRHANFENGSLEFWSPVVRRWLSTAKALTVDEEKTVSGYKNARGRLFTATRKITDRTYLYMVAVFANRDFVYTYECWGIEDAVSAARDQIEESMATLRID